MSYYRNAELKESAAKTLLLSENYDTSVALSCLAVELYLKSRLGNLSVEEQDRFELTHDTIGIYHSLAKKFGGNADLLEAVKMCKKYFSEVRYISNGNFDFYTKMIAENFIQYVAIIKDYVDTNCMVDIEDLEKKFKK